MKFEDTKNCLRQNTLSQGPQPAPAMMFKTRAGYSPVPVQPTDQTDKIMLLQDQISKLQSTIDKQAMLAQINSTPLNSMQSQPQPQTRALPPPTTVTANKAVKVAKRDVILMWITFPHLETWTGGHGDQLWTLHLLTSTSQSWVVRSQYTMTRGTIRPLRQCSPHARS